MDVFSWRDELFASIAHHIEAVGWSVVHVGGGGCVVPGCCGEHESDLVELGLPAYGYTVGLPVRFDHPELVLVGMEGRFPGDTGFDRQVRRAQPMLARPASRDRPRR